MEPITALVSNPFTLREHRRIFGPGILPSNKAIAIERRRVLLNMQESLTGARARPHNENSVRIRQDWSTHELHFIEARIPDLDEAIESIWKVGPFDFPTWFKLGKDIVMDMMNKQVFKNGSLENAHALLSHLENAANRRGWKPFHKALSGLCELLQLGKGYRPRTEKEIAFFDFFLTLADFPMERFAEI